MKKLISLVVATMMTLVIASVPVCAAGFQQVGTNFVYVKNDGTLMTGKACINYTPCLFDDNGILLKMGPEVMDGVWSQDAKGIKYTFADKSYPMGQWFINGLVCNFDDNGYFVSFGQLPVQQTPMVQTQTTTQQVIDQSQYEMEQRRAEFNAATDRALEMAEYQRRYNSFINKMEGGRDLNSRSSNMKITFSVK